jgi:hypothetical protein
MVRKSILKKYEPDIFYTSSYKYTKKFSKGEFYTDKYRIFRIEKKDESIFMDSSGVVGVFCFAFFVSTRFIAVLAHIFLFFVGANNKINKQRDTN